MEYISDVRVSPDGALVAFADHPVLGDDRGSLAVIDRAGKKRTLASGYSSVQGVAWAANGDEVWFTASDKGSARSLFAATPAGVLRTVTRAPSSLHLGDAGADGSALVWQENSWSGIRGRVRGDTADRELSWLDWSTVPRISQDGRTLIFTEEGDGGGVDYSIYMRSVDGDPAVRLGSGNGLALSPDGKWVLSLHLAPAPAQYWLLPTGAGEPRQVTDDALAHDIGWFGADGQHIIFPAYDPGGQSRMYVQDLSGGPPKPITPDGVTGPPSPDGTLVAFEGKLYAASGAAPRPIPGFAPGDRVEGWTGDSRALFLRHDLPSEDQQVFRLELATGRRTLLHEIARLPNARPGPWFTITPDGSAYFLSYSVNQSELFRVTGLK